MPLVRRLLAAVAATGVAVTISLAFAYFDASQDKSGDAMDAYAKGAAASPILVAALFILYLALANTDFVSRERSYLRAVVAAILSVAVVVLIPCITWIVVSHESLTSLKTYEPTLGALLLGVLWLAPGALVLVSILQRHNYRIERPRGR